ncbi:hypothetical protein EDD85DRAFT_940992 [Armillaria nabsnona]|nr:hypothetical protein EDD85DRAFT_940992 [Armillaria nabsnona]
MRTSKDAGVVVKVGNGAQMHKVSCRPAVSAMPECEPDSNRAPADTGMVYVYSGIAERYACDCLLPVALPSSIAREHVIKYNGTNLTVKDIKGCPSGFWVRTLQSKTGNIYLFEASSEIQGGPPKIFITGKIKGNRRRVNEWVYHDARSDSRHLYGKECMERQGLQTLVERTCVTGKAALYYKSPISQQIERGHNWKDVSSQPHLIVISRKMRSSDSYSKAGDLQRTRRNMLKVKKSEQEELQALRAT